jgi:hypothetical protein
MGHPDGAHTHGGGSSGLGELLVILLAVALLGPALAAAVAELVHVLLIVAGVIVGVGATGLAGLLAWQLRRTRVDAARAMPPRTLVARAAPPLPQARRAGELPAAPQREPPGGLHLHFHGLDAAQVAAIIARQQEGDVNPGG